MKTKSLFIVTTLLLLASCGGGYNPPDRPTTNHSPIASFLYKTSHPFYAHFTNTSKDATYYSWDFGDGTTSSEKNPIHKYSGKGVYKVVLTAKDNGKTDTYTNNITVIAPTKCYITGIIYDKTPKNNEYYSIRCTDDYILFETLYWYTDWVLLSSANIPYTYTLKSKKQIDFNIEKYIIRLYTNENTSGTGSEIANWNLYPSSVKSDFSERLSGTIDNAKISVLLEWRD